MITVWSKLSIQAAESHMPQEMLTKLGGHIAIHPWWHARARLVSKFIEMYFPDRPNKILDVGCGWGVTLDYLEALGHDVWGLDVGLESLEMLDKPSRDLILGDIENGMIPDEKLGFFDVVLALDVLEHLDRPDNAIKNLTKLVRPGGMVIITVPAMMELWSEFDVIQGHRKRFSKMEVVELYKNEMLLEKCRVGYCWPWLVHFARLTRRKNKVAADSIAIDSWKIYEQYVRPGPWVFRRLMGLALRLSERSAMRGKSRQGTTILAIGFHKIPAEGVSFH